MVTITPPASNTGTPARPSSPPAEATMDVDSVPQSPTAAPVTQGSAAPAPSAVGGSSAAAQRADKASDTEEDDEVRPAKPNRPKMRDMFDGEIVDRWNKEFGDLFVPQSSAASAAPAVVPPA